MLAPIFSTGGKVYFTGGKGTFCTKTKKFEEVGKYFRKATHMGSVAKPGF